MLHLQSLCAAVVQVVALAREVLGGNGVQADFHVAKQFCDMEAIYTYEVGVSCRERQNDRKWDSMNCSMGHVLFEASPT
jgi:hypothetical protein